MAKKVGMIGHVDHGKTCLTAALTGVILEQTELGKLRVALKQAEEEIRRLHAIHAPKYEGKVGEPDLAIADLARDTLEGRI